MKVRSPLHTTFLLSEILHEEIYQEIDEAFGSPRVLIGNSRKRELGVACLVAHGGCRNTAFVTTARTVRDRYCEGPTFS